MKVYLVVNTEFNRYDADDVCCHILSACKSREAAKHIVSEIKANSPFDEDLTIVEVKAGKDYRKNPICLVP